MNDGALEAQNLLNQMFQSCHDIEIVIPEVTDDYWGYYFVPWGERSIMWGEEVETRVLMKNDRKSAYCDICMGKCTF